MTLKLFLHPLSSFCHKALIALYENETPFEASIVNFGDAESRQEFFERWPIGKIPVLHDSSTGMNLPETSVIIEYIHQRYPGPVKFLPDNADQALQTRLWDRLFDLYIHMPMQRIVGERLRPQDKPDPHGLAEAHSTLDKAYAVLEKHMADRQYPGCDHFSLADCAASPALFYASIVHPFGDEMPHTKAYFERLMERPAIKRTIAEARPYFDYFPFKEQMPPRFLQG